jgi:hypothetical protein
MQKRTVYSQWHFFKAGQGCFYCGQVMTRKSRSFTFIYDCGSRQGTAILKREIHKFKTYLSREPKDAIDLLVLSHLDADHVNQVDYLLKGCVCKIVVLPYLRPLDRLYLYFDAGFDDSTDDDTFREFMIDPAAFLITRGAERVIFITGNDENGLLNVNLPGPNSPEVESQAREETKDGDLFNPEVLLRIDDDANDSEQLEFMQANPGKVEFRKANGGIQAGLFWEFFFYQVPQPAAAIAGFIKQVTNHFGVLLNLGCLTGEGLKEIFKMQSKVDELKRTFKSIFKETNSTGLLVMHGPINHYFAHKANSILRPICFTLLSGDTDMHKGYPPYIKNRLPYICVFQVPHHGSDKNWDIGKLKGLFDCDLVINYGTKNSYGHPGPTVTTNILSTSSGWEKHDNTELSTFRYEVYAYYSATGRHWELAPLGRTHQPVVTTSEYRTVDDQEDFGRRTDVRALSLGRAQWDPNEFSAKVWRHVNGRWSRQSEELPLHRALDLAILVTSSMIGEVIGNLPGHYLELEILQPEEMETLRNFIKDNKGILEERLWELRLLTNQYFDQ